MATLQQILDRQKEVSGQVSAQTRAYGLALVVAAWTLLTVHDDPLKAMVTHVHRRLLLSVVICGFAVLFFDLAQYVALTHVAASARKQAEASVSQEAPYHHGVIFWAGQTCYRLKQVALLFGTAFLLLVARGLWLAQ